MLWIRQSAIDHTMYVSLSTEQTIKGFHAIEHGEAECTDWRVSGLEETFISAQDAMRIIDAIVCELWDHAVCQ